MNFNYYSYIFCSVFIVLLSSCLGNDDTSTEYTYSPNAQILTFSLSNDSVPELAKVLFTIDQLSSEIYNNDSLVFGVDTARMRKVKLTFTTAGSYVCYVPDINADSAQISSSDSIEIATFINHPQKYIRVYAYDGGIKEYTLNLRLHTVDPDSIIYQKLENSDLKEKGVDQTVVWFEGAFRNFVNKDGSVLYYSAQPATSLSWEPGVSTAIPTGLIVKNIRVYGSFLVANTQDGKLYKSADCINWEQIPDVNGNALTGVVAVFGELPGKGVSLLLQENGNDSFVFTDLSQSWQTVPATLPAGFPVKGFSTVSLVDRFPQLYIVGGFNEQGQPVQNATWMLSDDGVSWDRLDGNSCGVAGANFFYYDQRFFMINGVVGDQCNGAVYISKNKGIYWQTGLDKYLLPLGYHPYRKEASVCITPDNSIYIFGGQLMDKDNTILTDVWRGKMNKFGFTD